METKKRPLLIMKPAIVVPFADDPNIWITQERLEIPITKLEDAHLDNIIKKMQKNPGWRADQRPLIFNEKKERIRRDLASKSKAGKILYGKI